MRITLIILYACGVEYQWPHLHVCMHVCMFNWQIIHAGWLSAYACTKLMLACKEHEHCILYFTVSGYMKIKKCMHIYVHVHKQEHACFTRGCMLFNLAHTLTTNAVDMKRGNCPHVLYVDG